MRALIFILTLLIGFQPTAWAMGNGTPSGTDTSLKAIPRLDTQRVSSMRSAPQFKHAGKMRVSEKNHHGCLNMAGLTTNNAATNCLSDCPGYCASSLFLERPPLEHDQRDASFIAYQTPSLSSFVSLTGSPEIQPPRSRIQFS